MKKNIRIASLALACALPVLAFVACSSDSTPSAGPVNKQPDPTADSGGPGDPNKPETSTGPEGGGPNACDNGITFDNAGRIPGWPSAIPQP